MKIAVICAMDEELQAIIQGLNLKVTSHKSSLGFAIYSAKFVNKAKVEHELILLLCGIGKVNAAIYTQFVIDKYMPEKIINVGVAGSLSNNITFGDVVVATDLVHHDMDVTGFDLPLGQIPRMDTFSFQSDKELLALTTTISSPDFQVVQGRIATGDQFIDDAKKAKFILDTFGATACEMEGAAVAQTCYVNKIPFLIVRAMSDMAGGDGNQATHSYFELKEMAASRSAYVIKSLLGSLC